MISPPAILCLKISGETHAPHEAQDGGKNTSPRPSPHLTPPPQSNAEREKCSLCLDMPPEREKVSAGRMRRFRERATVNPNFTEACS